MSLPPESYLNNPALTIILFAAMVKRLGGDATITQADIDAVAYNKLLEHGNSDGSLRFELVEREMAS